MTWIQKEESPGRQSRSLLSKESFSIFASFLAQFMLAEVQYGGRVTDDFDKRLLNTFTNVWFNDQLLVTGFKFYDGYTLPDCKTVEEYSEFITNLPIQVKIL